MDADTFVEWVHIELDDVEDEVNEKKKKTSATLLLHPCCEPSSPVVSSSSKTSMSPSTSLPSTTTTHPSIQVSSVPSTSSLENHPNVHDPHPSSPLLIGSFPNTPPLEKHTPHAFSSPSFFSNPTTWVPLFPSLPVLPCTWDPSPNDNHADGQPPQHLSVSVPSLSVASVWHSVMSLWHVHVSRMLQWCMGYVCFLVMTNKAWMGKYVVKHTCLWDCRLTTDFNKEWQTKWIFNVSHYLLSPFGYLVFGTGYHAWKALWRSLVNEVKGGIHCILEVSEKLVTLLQRPWDDFSQCF